MLGAGLDGGQSSLTPVGRSHRVSSKLSHNQFKMNRLVIKKIMDCYGPNVTNRNAPSSGYHNLFLIIHGKHCSL